MVDFLYVSKLIRIKLNVVLKQLKLNILILLQRDMYVIKGNRCCFTEFIKKKMLACI